MYFKAVLHDGSNETALIFYNPGLHGILEKAINTDKAVKISDFKSKHDQFEKADFIWKGEEYYKQLKHLYRIGKNNDRHLLREGGECNCIWKCIKCIRERNFHEVLNKKEKECQHIW